MALNPEIQELARKEVDEIFEDPYCYNDNMITYDAANSNLKYVERCLLETMRLFPPVFVAVRELKTPLKIGKDVSIWNRYFIHSQIFMQIIFCYN